MPYKFPTRRPASTKKSASFRPSDVVATAERVRMGLIKGQVPDSIQEWWIAQALDRLRLEYFYQFRVFGGRQIAGGQVVDFLVLVGGAWVALQYYGGYWHRSELKGNDRLEEQALLAEFGHLVILTDADGESYDTIYAAVRRELRV